MVNFTFFKKSFLLLLIILFAGRVNAQWCNTGLYTIGCSLDYIVTVTTTGGITNINNANTGCTNVNGTGYTYYSTMTHTAAINTTVNYYILNNASWTEAYGMWVDFNNNGSFTDAGEQVYNNSLGGGGSVSSSFTVPSSAVPGMTRMRIRCNFGTAPTPCGSLAEGECEDYNFMITSPCTAPSGLNATSITSNTATVSWTAVSGSVGYDYAVDQNATSPSGTPLSTTLTSVPVTGLTPSTNYYLHVRNKCSATGISAWVNYPFTTLPPCYPPINFNTTNLTPISTTINWDSWASALSYDYLVDQNSNAPVSTTGITNTLNTFAPVTGLTENTKYYVHIRSLCAAGQMSNWSLDSFTTPIPCRPPSISIDYVNTDEAVAFWAAVPTAEYYEYAVTTSATPPAIGTRYVYTSIHTSALHDGKQYFVHVRSHCNSIGIIGTSDWGTASFTTFPTSVGSIDGKPFIEAYPNPVSGILNVNIKGIISGNSTITVVDLSGKILRSSIPVSGKNSIDLNNLTPGVYMLRYNDDIHTETIRLTKQ